MKTLILAALLLVSAGASQADSVWTYTGNSVSGATNLSYPIPSIGPNPCSCALSGTVTLDSLGNATSWDFTDGTHELTNLNSTGNFGSYYGFGEIGHFDSWFVQITGAGISMLTEFYGSTFEATDSVLVNGQGFLGIEGNRGVWTDPVSTPEPGSLPLLVGAMIWLAIVFYCMGYQSTLKRLA